MAKKATSEHTSKTVATKASELLSNPKTPAKVKSVAASALTQAANKPKMPPKPKAASKKGK